MKVSVASLLVFVGAAAAASLKPLAEGNSICAPGEYGLKPHHECDKFYMCNNGLATIQTCSNKLYFRMDIHVCDFAERVVDCEGGFRHTSSEEDDEYIPEDPEPVDPEIPAAPVDPVPEVPSPIEPVPEVPVPVDPSSCPLTPYYYLTNPSDPTSFFICQDGQSRGTGNCGVNLTFSQDKQACL